MTDDATAKLWMDWLENVPSVNGKNIHQALKDNDVKMTFSSKSKMLLALYEKAKTVADP